MTEVEPVLNTQNKLGEGPIWNGAEQALYWVDVEAHRFHRYTPASGKHEMFEVGLPVASLAFRRNGGLVMATRDGFAFWNVETLQFIVDPEMHKPRARFNDGAVDRQGRFWAGTMDAGFTSALYRLDADLSVHTMETEIGVSNGIGWSPDNSTMYYTDSPRKVIYAYDFDLATGRISNRHSLIETPDEPGVPDGLTIDSEGFIWSVRWGGYKMTRYAPDGTVDREIPLPVQYPTSCTFGGPDLTDLFITSAWTMLSPAERAAQPLAGDLFWLPTLVKGMEEPLFAG